MTSGVSAKPGAIEEELRPDVSDSSIAKNALAMAIARWDASGTSERNEDVGLVTAITDARRKHADRAKVRIEVKTICPVIQHIVEDQGRRLHAAGHILGHRLGELDNSGIGRLAIGRGQQSTVCLPTAVCGIREHFTRSTGSENVVRS